MAQTPKSVSANLTYSKSTIYTVPSATNTVVKSIIFVSPVTTTVGVYLYKTTGGVTYPVNYMTAPFTQGSGGSPSYGINLLPAPITLNTGDSLSANTNFEVMPMLDVIQNLTWNTNSIGWKVNKYSNGIWLCVGNSSSSSYEGSNIILVTSTDGKTWTQVSFVNDFYPFDAVYGTSNTWILTGQTTPSGGTAGTYYYSTNNGSTWTSAVISGALSNTAQCWYLNGYYFIATSLGQLYYSSNATTWTDTGLYTYQPNLTISSMSYLNSKYVVATVNGGQFTTTNLSTWVSPYFVPTTGTFNAVLNGVVYHTSAGKFFACTNDSSGNGAITSSTDGITWTIVNTGYTQIIPDLGNPATIQNSGGSNNYLLACDGNNSAIYSTNGGTSWTQATLNGSLPTGSAPYSLGNGNFFFSNFGNQFWITPNPWSTPGTSYTFSTSGFYFADNTQIAIASNGTAFVMWYLNGASPQTWSKIYNTTTATTGSSYNLTPGAISASTYGGPVAGAYFNSYYYILSSNGYLFRSSTVTSTLTQVAANLFNGATGSRASMAVIGSRLVIWSTTTNFGFKSSADGINWESSYPKFWPTYTYNQYSTLCQSRLASSGSICVFAASYSGSFGAMPVAVTTDGITWNNLPFQTTGMTTVNSNTIQWVLDVDPVGATGVYTVTDASTPSTYSLIYPNNNINNSFTFSYNQQAQAFYTGGKYHINGALSGGITSTSLSLNTFYATSYGYGLSFIPFNNPNEQFFAGTNSTPVLSSDGTTTVLIDLNSNTNYYFDIYQGTWANVEGGYVNLGLIEIS